jgi:hypothetical protein
MLLSEFLVLGTMEAFDLGFTVVPVFEVTYRTSYEWGFLELHTMSNIRQALALC